MADNIFIRDTLSTYYDEIEPMDFYRSIFPKGELAEKGKMETGKYNCLAVELLPKEAERNVNKRIITDDLEEIAELQKSNNFIIISPISFIGKSRRSNNARFIYALAIDLDGVQKEANMRDLLHQINTVEYLPKPTYMVWSGTGLHLYYQFKEPIPCFKNITQQLAELKRELTVKIWNGYVSELSEQTQIASLFQGFRMVGGVTKGGNRTRAFITGEKVDIEYLNSFVSAKSRLTEYAYKSKLTLSEAEKKYPEWYQRRIVEGQKRGTWTAKRAVYDWWLSELKKKIMVGHRYYGVMVLSVYAKKCGIEREELEKDAFGLVSFLDAMTSEESNHFTREDVFSALEMYNDNYITFPIDSITKLTAIPIQKNKRNFRKQEKHLAIARMIRDFDHPDGSWRYTGGRPKKGTEQQKAILEWQAAHPGGSIKDCIEELGVSQTTAYKYWLNKRAKKSKKTE